MSLSVNKIIKIAILDLNNGYKNQGLRCIKDIVNNWELSIDNKIEIAEFDVRQKCEIPTLYYDIFISSGGPGNPLEEEDGAWAAKYFQWISEVEEWNNNPQNINKKSIFFICHSFQLACRYYKIGSISKRKSTAFGIFPCHILANLNEEPIFKNLKNPFFIVDSRDYQVIEQYEIYTKKEALEILAIEKERPHIPLARAIMGIRFNNYFVGTQFHPEADEASISYYLHTDEKKNIIIQNHGIHKWENMVHLIKEPDKIKYTNQHIIPNFLNYSIKFL